jgi:hypothetical protein
VLCSLNKLHLDLDAESCEPSSIRFARAAQKVLSQFMM